MDSKKKGLSKAGTRQEEIQFRDGRMDRQKKSESEAPFAAKKYSSLLLKPGTRTMGAERLEILVFYKSLNFEENKCLVL